MSMVVFAMSSFTLLLGTCLGVSSNQRSGERSLWSPKPVHDDNPRVRVPNGGDGDVRVPWHRCVYLCRVGIGASGGTLKPRRGGSRWAWQYNPQECKAPIGLIKQKSKEKENEIGILALRPNVLHTPHPVIYRPPRRPASRVPPGTWRRTFDGHGGNSRDKAADLDWNPNSKELRCLLYGRHEPGQLPDPLDNPVLLKPGPRG